ncbi:hypothetical protein [Candidatus Amarolinea aalborgensis]|uniref:hypothetical protein n=1 Tax=Candidatus Amarolinea aalborgensis TaxID=2249329 RepID=UPI003BF9C329
MTTPNLIVQPRELARSIRELRRQKEQMDVITAARDREIAAAEQARLDANRPYDAQLAEFLDLEQGARAVVKSTSAKASSAAVETPPLMPISDPVRTLTECVSEMEGILTSLETRVVILRLVDVPSDVDQAKVKDILRISVEAPVKSGFKFDCSVRWARNYIPVLKALGVKAEFEI